MPLPILGKCDPSELEAVGDFLGRPRPEAFSRYRQLTSAPTTYVIALPLWRSPIDRTPAGTRGSVGGRRAHTRQLRLCHLSCLIAGFASSEHPDASTHSLPSTSGEDGWEEGRKCRRSSSDTDFSLPTGVLAVAGFGGGRVPEYRQGVTPRRWECKSRCRRAKRGHVSSTLLEGLIRMDKGNEPRGMIIGRSRPPCYWGLRGLDGSKGPDEAAGMRSL